VLGMASNFESRAYGGPTVASGGAALGMASNMYIESRHGYSDPAPPPPGEAVMTWTSQAYDGVAVSVASTNNDQGGVWENSRPHQWDIQTRRPKEGGEGSSHKREENLGRHEREENLGRHEREENLGRHEREENLGRHQRVDPSRQEPNNLLPHKREDDYGGSLQPNDHRRFQHNNDRYVQKPNTPNEPNERLPQHQGDNHRLSTRWKIIVRSTR
jgi:hypothetical protein